MDSRPLSIAPIYGCIESRGRAVTELECDCDRVVVSLASSEAAIVRGIRNHRTSYAERCESIQPCRLVGIVSVFADYSVFETCGNGRLCNRGGAQKQARQKSAKHKLQAEAD